MTVEEARTLKSNMHATFDSPQGKEVLEYLKSLCHWNPTFYDTNDTNDIIERDSQRKILGTIYTILSLSPEQISLLTKEGV